MTTSKWEKRFVELLDGEPISANTRASFLMVLEEREQELRERIETWRDTKTSYMTQMDTKKDFERGELAKELTQDILAFLQGDNK